MSHDGTVVAVVPVLVIRMLTDGQPALRCGARVLPGSTRTSGARCGARRGTKGSAAHALKARLPSRGRNHSRRRPRRRPRWRPRPPLPPSHPPWPGFIHLHQHVHIHDGLPAGHSLPATSRAHHGPLLRLRGRTRNPYHTRLAPVAGRTPIQSTARRPHHCAARYVPAAHLLDGLRRCSLH